MMMEEQLISLNTNVTDAILNHCTPYTSLFDKTTRLYVYSIHHALSDLENVVNK